MAAYVCADLHLGHRNIHNYRAYFDKDTISLPQTGSMKTFADSAEHDAFVVEQWHAMKFKTRRDTIYVLGDIAFTDEAWDLFDSLPGRKVVILGNHCTEGAGSIQKIASLKSVNSVHAALNYKGYWLTHIPIHPAELRGKRNIHGHMHDKRIDDPRYMCVSLEHTRMRPINLDAVVTEFERRQNLNHVWKTFGWRTALKSLI